MARLTKFQKESYGDDVLYVLRSIDINSWSSDILYRKEGVDDNGNPILDDYQIIAETKLPPDTGSWVREIFLRLGGLISYVKDVSEREGTWHIYNGQYHKAVTEEQVAQVIQECSYQYSFVLRDITRLWNDSLEMTIKRESEGMDIEDKAKLSRSLRKEAKEEFNFLFGEHKKVDNELRTSSRSKRLVDDLKHYVHRTPQEMKKHDKDYLVFKDYAFNARKFIDKSRTLPDSMINALFVECLEKPSPDILVMRGVDWEIKDTHLIPAGYSLASDDDSAVAPNFMRFLEGSVCKDDKRLGRKFPEVVDMIEMLLQGFGVALIGAPLTARAWFGIKGTQSSGKSVLQTLIMEDMFPSYCTTVQRTAFMYGSGNDKDASFALHNLNEMRLSFSDEIEGTLRGDIIKQFSGGSTMSTEAKGKQATSWEPQGLLVLTSNKFYNFDYSDGPMLERFKPILMNKSYNNSKDKDLNLGEKLLRERKDIFRVLLRGCIRAVRKMEARGTDRETHISMDKRSWILVDTPWVSDYKKEFVVEKDYEYFLKEVMKNEALVVEPTGNRCSKLTDLNKYYKMWKEKNNLEPPKRNELSNFLREKAMIENYRGSLVISGMVIDTLKMSKLCTGEKVEL